MTDILQQVLVATDGSENGDRAVSFALALARRHSGKLLFCYAVDHAAAIAESSTANGGMAVLPLVQSLDEAAASILAAAAKLATDQGVVASTSVLDGRSAQAIADCATERRVDAIVIGTQGKRGLERFFLGSTAEGVLRRADVPTFVVPPGATDAQRVDPILVAIDDSDPSDAAAAFALELAAADRARLVFCGVSETNDLLGKAATYGYDPTPMLEELRATATALVAAHADRARKAGITCDSVVAEGDAVEEILQAAQTRHAASIVIGTHGRRGLRRFFVGSVAESLIRRSPVPVAVVRVFASA